MVYTNPNWNILICYDYRRASSLRNEQTICSYTAKFKCIRCGDRASNQVCCITKGRFSGTSGTTDSLHHVTLIYNNFAKINQLDLILLIKRKKKNSKSCNCALRNDSEKVLLFVLRTVFPSAPSVMSGSLYNTSVFLFLLLLQQTLNDAEEKVLEILCLGISRRASSFT